MTCIALVFGKKSRIAMHFGNIAIVFGTIDHEISIT